MIGARRLAAAARKWKGSAARALRGGASSCRRSPSRRCRCATISCRCSAMRPAFACVRSAGARPRARIARASPAIVAYRRLRDGRRRAGHERRGRLVEGPQREVQLARRAWSAGSSSPDRVARMRLVAASAPPGLEPSKTPDVSTRQRDHSRRSPRLCRDLVRAWPWSRCVIYAIAVRKRLEAPQTVSGERHVLSNGLTVAVDPMAGAESVARRPLCSVGSRSEPARLNGLAHLVEHMVFKGAGGRDTRALAEVIEDVGGSLNAWTAPRPDRVPRPRAGARPAARRRTDRRPGPRARISTRPTSSARSR